MRHSEITQVLTDVLDTSKAIASDLRQQQTKLTRHIVKLNDWRDAEDYARQSFELYQTAKANNHNAKQLTILLKNLEGKKESLDLKHYTPAQLAVEELLK